MGRKPKMYYLLRPGSCSCFYIPGIHLHFYVIISFLFVCFLKLEIQNIDFDFMLIADPSDSRLHGNRVETVKKNLIHYTQWTKLMHHIFTAFHGPMFHSRIYTLKHCKNGSYIIYASVSKAWNF